MFYNKLYILINQTVKVRLKPILCAPIRLITGDCLSLSERDEKTYEKRISKISLKFVGCGGVGSPKSFYLHTNHDCFIFNCGEGTQKAAEEFGHKISNITDIFITNPIWSNIGGLAGLSKNAEMTGIKEVNVHGPDETIDFLKSIRYFLTFSTLKLNSPKLSINNSGNFVYTNSNTDVEYVPLSKQYSEADIKDVLKYSFLSPGTDCFGRRLSPQLLTTEVHKPIDDIQKGRISTSMAYICQIQPYKSRVNLLKCVDYGITPGPMLMKLRNKEDVTLPDGSVVKYDDLCEFICPGATVIVIDCSDHTVLESLINNSSFDKYFVKNVEDNEVPRYIVHFTPENILQNPKYRKWMSMFGPNTEHFILNEQNRCINSEKVHILQHQLNLLSPTIFPLLEDEKYEYPDDNVAEFQQEDGLKICRLKNNYELQIRPMKTYIKKPIDKSLFIKEIEELKKMDNFTEQLQGFYLKLNEKTAALGEISEYPKLTMLGTGSGGSSSRRNASGILLQNSENSSMILDCGEGVLLQIFRIFGKEKGYEILSSIKGIYISHLHADHHLGLFSLLLERSKVADTPVYLFAPERIKPWLQYYNQSFEEVMKHIILMENKLFFLYNQKTIPHYTRTKMFRSLEIQDLKTVYVKHCTHAFGVMVNLNDGKSLVYSGDTIYPSPQLLALGNNCDLLIHEATHEDDLAEEAKKKMHSTISQAIAAGKQMNAKHILLTHFSQRYTVVPLIPNTDYDLSNVGFSFDNMQIRMSELPLIPLFNTMLKPLFQHYYDDLNSRTFKRIQKRKLALKV